MEEVKNAVEKVAENVELIAVSADDLLTYTKNGMVIGFAYGVSSVFTAYYGMKLCKKVADEAVRVTDITVNHMKQKRKLKKMQKEAAKSMQEQEPVNNDDSVETE